MEGKIITTILPQDVKQKIRPVLVLREFPKYGDLLVCGISSQLHQYIEGFDIIINEQHPDFKNSGLKHPGICRLNFLALLPKNKFLGELGYISAVAHTTLLKNLSHYLVANIK